MTWDPAGQVYVSNWSYRPVGLPDKTEFHLACEVVDEFGNTAVEATSGVATVDGSVGNPIDELIVKRTQNGKVGLWRVNSDQSQWKLVVDETSIPGFSDFDSLLLSSDSQKIVFQASTSTGRQLWLVNVDGSGLRLLIGGLGSGSPRCYAFAPDGTAVAAATTANGVVVQPLNGATIDVKPGMTGASLAWSPDSRSLFALPSSGSGSLIWDRATQTQTPATTGTGMYLGQALWPSPDKILYVTLGGGILVRQLDVPTDTASTLVNLGNGLTDAINLSRDNSQICCSVTGPPGPVMQAGDRLLLQPVAGGTGTYLNPTPIVGNGFYSKDGLRLYSVAWATPSSSIWEVQQCNVDGSSPSIILSNCELMGVR